MLSLYKMMDVSPTTWHMKVPEYLSYFYAFNQFMFALGFMDSMLGTMMGTDPAMIPAFTGPVGDFGNFGIGGSSLALGYLMRIEPGKSVSEIKKIFQVFA